MRLGITLYHLTRHRPPKHVVILFFTIMALGVTGVLVERGDLWPDWLTPNPRVHIGPVR